MLPLTVAAEVDPVARELGPLFHVERLEHSGPVSRIYVAREVDGGRLVALKVLPRTDDGGGDAAAAFQASMAAVAVLDHPHIIPVYRYGVTPALLWYSMKRVEGRSLAELLRDAGPLELSPCRRLCEQIADALAYAHRRGVMHGNLKPANVVVGPDEWAVVGDFAATTNQRQARLSRYVAPEERYARQPGPAADQYALATLVAECLQGAAVPAHVSEALARATSHEPAARFPSVLDFMAALESGPLPAPPGPPALPVAAPRATRGALLVDGEYESPVPSDGGARSWRRNVVGAGLALLLAGAVVSGIQLMGRRRASLDRSVVPPLELSRADSGVVARGSPPPSPLPLPAPRPRRPAPLANNRPSIGAPGRLFVSATPWGDLYIDNRLIGHTPMADLPLAPGRHRVRIVRDGFRPFEQTIDIAPGGEQRLTGITLPALAP